MTKSMKYILLSALKQQYSNYFIIKSSISIFHNFFISYRVDDLLIMFYQSLLILRLLLIVLTFVLWTLIVSLLITPLNKRDVYYTTILKDHPLIIGSLITLKPHPFNHPVTLFIMRDLG